VREMRNAHKILVGNPKGRNNFAVLGVDERVILKLMLDKYNVTTWTLLSQPVVICCKNINTFADSIINEEIFT
jgi:hypothetical protein